uniref:G-protein coupled receptors family 3 profile domain-containing protein n=1 Tax=Pygocentrus nattereri TaxID=42514 RepID=A0A3B4EAB9_PYGNA
MFVNSMNFRELRFARAMKFTIHEINNRTDLLPGITIGYQIYDSCAEVAMALKLAFQFANGMESFFNNTDSCVKSAAAAVPALVGDSYSISSITMTRMLAAALVKLVKYFGWTWIGAVRSDSVYGNTGMASFLKAAQEEGICVEYSEVFYRTEPRSKLERVANVIRRSTARVIVAFLHEGEVRLLLEELTRQPPPPLQWIGSDAWIVDPEFLRFNMCAGAIGFGVPRSVIPGLREFLLDLSPAQALKSPLLTEFWESSFSCSLKGSSEGARECDGSEDIRALQNPYTDTSQLRITNMVYEATYAIAHAIHGVICNDTQCDKSAKFTPCDPSILNTLTYVNLTYLTLAIIQHIQTCFKVVKCPLPLPFFVFKITMNVLHLSNVFQVPRSVCSESCPPGTWKAVQKGKPVCCYDCIPCAEGEISNKTDSLNCVRCPPEFWPNTQRDECLPKPVEFLSWDDTLTVLHHILSTQLQCCVTVLSYILV